MRKSTLSLALAIVAAFAFTVAPIPAEAGGSRGGDSQGFFIKFGDGGFRWHDGDIKYVKNSRRHASRRHHGARSHYDEYTRHERRLIEKRDKLQYKTQKALRKGNFEKAQRRLTRLIEVDYHLQEHYSAHASCNH